MAKAQIKELMCKVLLYTVYAFAVSVIVFSIGLGLGWWGELV